MLRTWSSQNRDMTSRESTPKSRNSRDISLAKDTLVAWKALQAYLSASAMRTSTTRTGWSRKPNRSVTASATPGSEVPTTSEGRGEEVGDPRALPQELRAHRGPDGDLRAGQASGERRGHHILDRPRGHGAADDDAVLAATPVAPRRAAPPRCRQRPAGCRTSPCRRVPPTASRRTRATRRPRRERRRTTSSRATCRRPPPGRRARPGPARPPGCGRARISSTLAASTSTPQTSCPWEARQAAVTVPT